MQSVTMEVCVCVCVLQSVMMHCLGRVHESYNKLLITQAALVPHVGVWHSSDVCPRALHHYRANNLRVALEPMQ